MSIYNIHGFVLSVEGPADKIFGREYWYFKVSEVPQKIDLFIKVSEEDCLPTRVWGSGKGMLIPFDESENTLWYNKGVELVKEYLIHYCEFLMYWSNKTWLHAGAVERDGKAYVFTGEGGVGKTSSVLNLVKNGFNYLSDDFLLVSDDGFAFPAPRRVHIFDYNLKDKDIAKRALGRKRLYYIPLSKLINVGAKLSPHRYIRYVFEKLRERTMLRVELLTLFPNCKIAPPTPISKIFFLERKKYKKIHRIEIESVPLYEYDSFCRKIAYINMYEWGDCLREYYRYVYLFGANNSRIENKIQHDIGILINALKKQKFIE
ncbi:MAG: hypothetical protein QXX41_06715 [Nitrososphaerota archaeon]